MHIFLHRNWEQDKEEISNKLHYMNLLKCPIQLLTFPDGGDLNFRSKSKSDQFAEKNNLQKYDYVLQPKTKGFTHSAAILKKAGLDSIFDITIAYPDALPKTEVDFYNGVIPREVNYYIERFNINDLPRLRLVWLNGARRDGGSKKKDSDTFTNIELFKKSLFCIPMAMA